jgi:hypothetical protein
MGRGKRSLPIFISGKLFPGTVETGLPERDAAINCSNPEEIQAAVTRWARWFRLQLWNLFESAAPPGCEGETVSIL